VPRRRLGDGAEEGKVVVMGNARLWIQGMRLRTLMVGIAPAIVGIVAGYRAGGSRATPRFAVTAVLCVLVALLLQIAVNYANDYSDGIRGTDSGRGGEEAQTNKPRRLTASGLVAPRQVLAAAGITAALACACGIAVVVLTGSYWLLAVGVACLVAGWFYTGGKHPYGYIGFGELGVFVFFGLVAVLGTQYALARTIDGMGIVGAIIIGMLACVLLMTNNLRDVREDAVYGKHSLAVRIGETNARRLLLAVYLLNMGLTIAAAFTPLAALLSQAFSLRCSAVYSAALCMPDATSLVGAWLAALAGGVCVWSATVMVGSIMRKDFHKALALAGSTPMLFAVVYAILGVLV
jgi:1,4-dihydroxy-2-naphthoate octaprenyltransferase